MDRPEPLAAMPNWQERFHDNHGKYVQLFEGKTVAERLRSWDNGVVFSETPIPVGRVFQIKLLEKATGWTGCLALGFTLQSPDDAKLMIPRMIQNDTKDPKWILAAACTSEDELIFDTDSLRVGQSLGCMISKKGNLHYFVNGEDKGVARRRLPTDKPLWGFVDINATAKKIKLEAAPPVAKPQRSRFTLKKFKGGSQQSAAAEQQPQPSEAESKPTDDVDFPQKPVENEATFRKQDPVSPERQRAALFGQDPDRNSPQKPAKHDTTLRKQDPVSPERQRAALFGQDPDRNSPQKPVEHRATSRKQDSPKRPVAAVSKEDSDQTSRQIELLRESLDAALIEIEDLKQQRSSAITEAQRQRSAAGEWYQQLQVLQQQLNPAGVQQSSPTSAVLDEIEVPRSEVEIQGEMTLRAWGSDGEGRFRGLRVGVRLLHPNVLRDYTSTRLQREMQIVTPLRHPNLVQFIAAAFDDDVSLQPSLIITEFLSTNLRMAYQDDLLPESRTSKLRIFQDIAYALYYLHERQEPIIHRNVNTPNVLLEELPNGVWRAKVSDFVSANLARLNQPMGEDAIIYTAPETLPQTGERDSSPAPPLSTKVDVYGFGVLVCEVVTSTLPDPTEYPGMLHQMHSQWLPMHKLVVLCTKRKPQERPTMWQVLDKLDVSRCLPTQS